MSGKYHVDKEAFYREVVQQDIFEAIACEKAIKITDLCTRAELKKLTRYGKGECEERIVDMHINFATCDVPIQRCTNEQFGS